MCVYNLCLSAFAGTLSVMMYPKNSQFEDIDTFAFHLAVSSIKDVGKVIKMEVLQEEVNPGQYLEASN
jgi:hypothetical protein